MMKSAFPEGIYARSTRPDDLHTFHPTEFDSNARAWITAPLRFAAIGPAVRCDPPYVEAIARATDTHLLICVMNHSVGRESR